MNRAPAATNPSDLREQAFTFTSEGERLVGIIHEPSGEPAPHGLLILVGGPQYRIGAHRQYVHLARAAAAAGIPVMRFDWRGVGDSEGQYPGFQHLKPDMDAAIAEFRRRMPQLRGVVLWGLCEGASAILLGGTDNPFVSGAAIVNPWVRTETGEAQTYLKHYYGSRFRNPENWKRILRGEINIARSAASILGLMRRALAGQTAEAGDNRPYPCRMADGLRRYDGATLLLMSGRDLVAREFDDTAASAPEWQGLLSRPTVSRVDIPETDHTFSSERWRRAAADATIRFVRSLP